ncbi:MAG: hypothetical protein EOP62_18995 [Sphingomonadales bacterium]|nr:MAG: hypothetical protein EOP62_18995 [Sphingomonadales bacterium]
MFLRPCGQAALLSSCALLAILAMPAAAQPVAPKDFSTAQSSEATAVLTGTVLDPVTGEYLRNAIVEVRTADGEVHSTVSGEGGAFRLSDLASGDATVTVRFTGYTSIEKQLSFAPGTNTKIDFSLREPGREAVEDKNEIVVSGVREGDAREIMAQRESMNITEVLSAESYGDIGDTNPAEFLKFMPGVDTDGTNGTAINVYLRGLPQNYTTVTINGMNLMSADANTGSGSARVFSFESMSLVGIDSIEIEKTISADVDANAPAGRIDIRTKKAFNRRKSLLTLQVSGATHENMWDSTKRTGSKSGGWGGRRLLPNAQLSYSNSFFNNRLGIAASIGRSDTYIEREQTTLSRNYVPTAISPDPLGINSIEFGQTQRQTSRLSANVNIDFRATDELTLSLMGVANRGFVYQASIAPTVTTGVRTRGITGDALYDFTTKQTATAATYAMARSTQYKVNKGNFIAPTFNWQRGDLKIDGYFTYSDAESYYDTPAKGEVLTMTSALSAPGNFSATRSKDLFASDWKVTQLGGGDWANPGSFGLSSSSTRPVIRTTNGSTAGVTNYSGALNFTAGTRIGSIPVEFKTGVKFSDTTYEFNDTSGNNLYTYNGPLTNAEFLREIQGSQQISFADSGGLLTTISGGNELYTPGLSKLYNMYKANPEQWTHTLTAANWLASRVTNYAHFTETTKAAYAMATGTITPKLKVRAGLRWERTDTNALEFDPLSPTELVAAGFAVNATTGQATTIPGLEKQYSRPMVDRKGNYSYFFPSASVKYEFDQQTQLQLGYSRTILRPEPDVLAGVVTRNDIDKIVNTPNPGLEPGISDNYSVRLARYFEPVGIVSIGLYQNTVKGMFQPYELTAAEFGNTNPEFADYTFITTAKVPGNAVKIRGVEVAFNHSLNYLPGPLKHLRIRGSFMYNDPNVPIVRVANKIGSLSLSYNDRRLRFNLNSVWTDDKYRSTTPSWFAARWDVSANASYKVYKNYEVFFSVSNLLNNNINVIVPGSLAPGGGLADHSAINVFNGRNGVIGVRARF